VAVVGGFAAGGLLVGAAAGAFQDDEPAAATVTDPAVAFDCPGGSPVGDLVGSTRVFVVGTHDDEDGWYRSRNPEDPAETWWIAAGAVELDGEAGDLPASGCDEPEPDSDELAADDTTTTTTGDTSTSTTSASTSTSTSTSTTQDAGPGTTTSTTPPPPPPDTKGPSLVLSLSEVKLWEADGGGVACGSVPRTSQLRAQASCSGP
jgi:hypothetical protein